MHENRTTILIADDNPHSRRELINHFERLPEFAVIGEARHGVEALELTRTLRPNLLILDDVLPYLDGLGVLTQLSAEERPPVLLLMSCSSDSLVQLYYQHGAQYCLLRPACPELVAQRAALVTGNQIVPMDGLLTRTVPIRSVTDLLRRMGVPAHLLGYQYLKDAVQYILNNGVECGMTKEVYPAIARMHSTVPTRVERSIRHAIEVAWSRADLSDLHRLFGATVHRGRGKPTNTEFVALLADHLRSAAG